MKTKKILIILCTIILLAVNSYGSGNCDDINSVVVSKTIYPNDEFFVLNEYLNPQSPEDPWGDYSTYDIIKDDSTNIVSSPVPLIGADLVIPITFSIASPGKHSIKFVFMKEDGQTCEKASIVIIEENTRIHPSLSINLSGVKPMLLLNNQYNLTVDIQNTGGTNIQNLNGFIDSTGLDFKDSQISVPTLRIGESLRLYFEFTPYTPGDDFLISSMIMSYESNNFFYYPGYKFYNVKNNDLTVSVVQKKESPGLIPIGYSVAIDKKPEPVIVINNKPNSWVDLLKLGIIVAFLLALFFIRQKKAD